MVSEFSSQNYLSESIASKVGLCAVGIHIGHKVIAEIFFGSNVLQLGLFQRSIL